MNISGLLHVNINCSDFKRSQAFYELLGFEVLMPVPPDGTGDVAAAVGFDTYRLRGALMKHRDGSVIDLLEWQQPADIDPPYKALNHLGLGRIALTTTDIAADTAELRALGVEFLSEAPATVAGPGGRDTHFICFKDPDGTVLELVQMPS
jgi:catechol 2,3-dioxygenase-like lactoylglutathione lyase family enzyme